MGERVEITKANCRHGYNNEPEAVPDIPEIKVLCGARRNVRVIEIFVKSSVNMIYSESNLPFKSADCESESHNTECEIK